MVNFHKILVDFLDRNFRQ